MTSGRDRALVAVGVLLVVGCGLPAGLLVVLALVPSLQATASVLALLATGIPYLPVPLLGTALGLVLVPRRAARWASVAVLATAVVLGSVPWWTGPAAAQPQETADDLRVVSLNTEFGQADLGAVLALAGAADMLAFQEITPEFVVSLEALGLGSDFPYRLGTAAYGPNGTMLWSRTPITLAGSASTRLTSVIASSTVRGTDWVVATVHAVSPMSGSRIWVEDGAAVEALLRPHVDEHLVVVGDFNAIDEHLTMRRLRGIGLANAMDGWPRARGDGAQLSWPTSPKVPTLIRIDHALHAASVSAWRPTYVVVEGTDHRAVVTTFRAR